MAKVGVLESSQIEVTLQANLSFYSVLSLKCSEPRVSCQSTKGCQVRAHRARVQSLEMNPHRLPGSASLLREASYSSIRLGCYDICKDSCAKMAPWASKESFGIKLGGGMMSGMLGAAICNPADLVSPVCFLIHCVRDHSRFPPSSRFGCNL